MSALEEPKKILVVDDSQTVLGFTASVLGAVGYEVETADSIWISSRIAEFKPDLILLDVNMGGCSGTAIVAALRNRSFAHHTRIVLYSSEHAVDLAQIVEECGAHGFITKTKNPEVLKRQVKRFLSADVLEGNPAAP